jgi:anti-sigma factor RsiW
MKTPPFSDDDLHAWADGRLDPERRAELDAWLASRPEHARELSDWRAMNERLHAAYDPVLDEPVPARLRADFPTMPLPRMALTRLRPSLRIAAVLGWLALGSLIGAAGGYRYAMQAAPAPALLDAAIDVPRRAAVAHAVYSPEQRHPVEVGADQEAHLVAWLSKRLGTPLRVPKLADQGYHLVGGRLLAAEAGPGAQFMYENDGGERLTLYVTAEGAPDGRTAFRYAEERGIGVFYWIDRGFAYALSGKAARDTLLPVADAVYRQLVP